MTRRWHAGRRARPCRCDRPGIIPGLSCTFLVEPSAGIEPATPSLPSMRGWFATPHSTSRPRITAQVGGAIGGGVVRRGEVACSAVSGKFLARRADRAAPAQRAAGPLTMDEPLR
jgi:hypothetical protein